jgi:hypothetical protein
MRHGGDHAPRPPRSRHPPPDGLTMDPSIFFFLAVVLLWAMALADGGTE